MGSNTSSNNNESKAVNSSNIYIRVLDGSSAGKTLAAQYNPQEISFSKSVGWSNGNEGAGTDCPALMFTAGQAISMSLELLFDYYEEASDDNLDKAIDEYGDVYSKEELHLGRILWRVSKM